VPQDRSKTALAAQMGVPIETGEGIVRKGQGKGHGAEIVRRAGYGKVTPESLAVFLEHYMQHGHKAKAALAAGLSYSSIRNAEKNDPEFAEEVEQAHELFIHDVLEKAAFEQGVEGIKKPIYNTKTGALLGHERVVQPRILELLLKRHDPNYRDKVDVNQKVSGGVVVVQAPPMTVDAWKQRISERNQQNRELIDAEATPSLPVEPDPKPGAPS